MKRKIAIFSLFAVLVLSACKTTRTVTKSVQPQLQPTAAVSPLAQVAEQVQKAQPQFRTANINKMSMAFDMNDRKINVSGTCKIRKDSAIFISIQPFLGIELFKAELTTDSMRVFDKMNHRYYVVDYDFFNKRFGVNVNFYSLQSLLTAQLFCIGKKEIQLDDCKLTTLPTGNKIEYQNNNILQTTETSALNTILKVVLSAKDSNYQLQTEYSNFGMLNGVNFPQTILLQATSEKKKASCEFSILRAEFNTELKFTGTNPDRFTKGDIDQLLKK